MSCDAIASNLMFRLSPRYAPDTECADSTEYAIVPLNASEISLSVKTLRISPRLLNFPSQ